MSDSSQYPSENGVMRNAPSDICKLLRRDPRAGLEKLALLPGGLYAFSKKPILGAIATDLNLVRAVLSDAGGRFQKSPAIGRFRYLLGDGTATSYFPPDGSEYYGDFKTLDDFRRYKRKVLLPAFKRERIIVHNDAIYKLNQVSQGSWEEGQTRDIYVDMSKLMLEIMITTLFNRSVTPLVVEAGKSALSSSAAVERRLHASFCPISGIFDRGTPILDKLWLFVPGKDNHSLRERHTKVEKAVTSLLNGEPLDHNPQNGLLYRLLEARDGHLGIKMSNDQINRSAIGLFFASYENSSTAASWILWCLATNPEAQELAYKEVSALLQESNDWQYITEKLQYVEACISEGLRLYPPVWSMAREAVEDVIIGSYKIPAKSILIMSPWLQHRHIQSWTNPENFMPERFIESKIINQGAYFPFGLGQRFCLGKGFAQIELKITIASILYKWRLKPVEESSPIPQLGVTQKPKNGIKVRLVRRNTPDA